MTALPLKIVIVHSSVSLPEDPFCFLGMVSKIDTDGRLVVYPVGMEKSERGTESPNHIIGFIIWS